LEFGDYELAAAAAGAGSGAERGQMHNGCGMNQTIRPTSTVPVVNMPVVPIIHFYQQQITGHHE